ncbi:MAG: cell wall hydrolase [Candidatus Sphingomonas colombiensis]|nr:cell wall hydrolase [Sphingomonas sp.]WEK44135.1 MAG: cell wall hydrolase [Sphingomonas sp.]
MSAATHPSERRAQRLAQRPARMRALRRRALLVLPLVGGAALAGAAAFHFTRSPAVPAPTSRAAAIAAIAPSGEFASPAQGTTGTIALPPVPRGAIVSGNGGVTPAAPFSTRFATTIDRARALECLTAAVYYEAASESDAGQRAVAQVVLNRVRHPAFPSTICGVVYQGATRASGCQFSFACDGSAARIPSRNAWARAARNAATILAGQVFAPVGLATHYHTYAVTPAWNRTLVMTDAIGAHFFHRWKGYWGTAAAFSGVYHGGEPQAAIPASLPAQAPVSITELPVSKPNPAGPPPVIQPAYTESGAALRDAASDNLPQSPVLDRWKDSGKPLR